MECLAVLPARGGSKRIPFKNGKQFCGKPMMAWPIQTALASGIFSRVIVSTDDDRLAGIARDCGAEVPFSRTPDLADDHTGTSDVVRDAITRLDISPDVLVCCIYPTAVFITKDDLQQAHAKLTSGKNRWIFTVGEFRAPIERSYQASPDGLIPRWPEQMPKRSQDFTPSFFDAGQFYIASADTWTRPGAHVWDGAGSIILPPERCVDIDTEADWNFAELLFGLHLKGDTTA